MNDSNMVVAADDISQRGQALFYPLDLDRVRQCVAQVL